MKSYVQGFCFAASGRARDRLRDARALGLARRLSARGSPSRRRMATRMPVTDHRRDLPASERFFAGGDTTIRGFALDTVGAPETISPTGFPTRRQRRARC